MKIIDNHIHIFSSLEGDPDVSPVGVFSFPAQEILSLMDRYEIEKAVLLQNPTIGTVNDEVEAAVIQYPNRFAGTLQADPFSPDAGEITEKYAAGGHFAALKYELSSDWGWMKRHPEVEFHYELLIPLIRIASRYHMAIVLDTGGCRKDDDCWKDGGCRKDSAGRYDAYLPEELRELILSFPNTTFVIEHGGFLLKDGDLPSWHSMIELGKLPNVYFGLSSIPTLTQQPYPCSEAVRELKLLCDTMGAEKLIFGTDIPGTLRMHTYRQMIDWVLKDANFLSSRDKELIFYENAEKIYFTGR